MSATAVAAPPTLSYQGRILKSDGSPLEYSAVSFVFKITSPSGSCVIYEEQFNGYDMTNSGGVFDVPIGSGTVLYPTDGSVNILDTFNNNRSFVCEGGANYSPVDTAGRLLRVRFHDGNGWKTVTPDNEIRSVPFAGYSLSAQKLGDNTIDSFVLKSEVNDSGSGSVSCDSGNFLTWDASAGKFGCSAVSGASGGTVTDVTASAPLAVTNGTSTPNITIQVASSSQNGYLSSSDWTTFNNKLGASTVFVGDVSGTASTTSVDKLKGTALSISGLGSDQFLKYNGANWVNSAITQSDVSGLSTTLSGLVAQSQFPASCAANQTLTFISPSGSFSCSSIAINGSQVSGNISGNAAGFTGSLAGDVSGTQGATSVDKIRGVAVSATAPTSNQVLTYTGGSWTPANLPSGLSGAGTAGYVPYYNTSTSLANSSLYYDGSKVGIGTASPDYPLEVADIGGGGKMLQIHRTSDLATSSLSSRIDFSFNDSSSEVDRGFLEFVGNNTTTTDEGAAFNLGIADASGVIQNRMTVTAGGDVGIGTTLPSQALDVVGNIKGTQLCIGTDCRSAWPGSGGGGTVTSVASGTGLTGGPITGSGTLAVDVGTTANKIVQLDSSAKLPAVDGSALTNLNLSSLNASNLTSGTVPATRMPALTGDVTSTAGTTATTLSKIQGKTLTVTSPASGDYLKYNGIGWVNSALSSGSLSDASDLLKASNMPSNCAANQTLTFSSPTGTWTCSTIANLDAGVITSGTIAAARLPASATYWSAATGGINYAGGNVGIGTTAPTLLLDVNGDFRLGRSYSETDVLQPSTSIISVSGDDLILEPRKDTTGRVRIKDVNSAANISFYDVGSGQIQSYGTTGTASSLVLNPGGGNVGIGTTTPGATLDVTGSSIVGRAASASVSTFSILYNETGSQSMGMQKRGTTATSNMGLPAGGAEIYSSGAPLGIFSNNSPSSYVAIGGGSGSGSTEYMRITNTGNVGIGTATPVNLLHLAGSGGDEGAPGIFIQDPTATNAYGGSLYYDDRGGLNTVKLSAVDNNADIGYVAIDRLSGNVGIGTDAPAEHLDLGGGNIKMGYQNLNCSAGVCGTTGGVAYLKCPAGTQILSGGCDCGSGTYYQLRGSYPTSGNQWNCVCGQSGAGQASATVYATCANIK